MFSEEETVPVTANKDLQPSKQVPDEPEKEEEDRQETDALGDASRAENADKDREPEKGPVEEVKKEEKSGRKFKFGLPNLKNKRRGKNKSKATA